MSIIKPKLLIPILVLLILVLANPSRSNFISYLHLVKYENTGRDFNGLIFSIYSSKGETERIFNEKEGQVMEISHRDYYLGFLGNFIWIKGYKKP